MQWLFFLFFFFSSISQASIDLHSHLFMNEGLGVIFRGDFSGPIRAHDWRDRFSLKVNPETLEKSGLQIVVATLYAHPLFVENQKEAIRIQIQQAQNLVRTHPRFALLRSPEEARTALKQGKIGVILALEGALGILETEKDYDEFIDERGIRIVTPIHFVDSEIGGAAFMKGFKLFANPFSAFESLFFPTRTAEGIRVNPRGIGPEGLKMARELIRRQVWMDFSHASDSAQETLFELLKKEKLPALYTHTILRKFHQAERGISQKQLEAIRDTDGVLGLIPSYSMLEHEIDHDHAHDRFQCDDGLSRFALHYLEARKILPASAIAIGSDFNGGLDHFPPDCRNPETFGEKGLFNASQLSLLWPALHRIAPEIPDQKNESTTYFIEAWARVMMQSDKRIASK